MITAINIKTELWNEIIKLLLADGWIVRYRYDNIEAGIDFDFTIMEKENEDIFFGWDNSIEGEIQCSESRIKELEQLVRYSFERSEPRNLRLSIVQKYRRQNDVP